MTTSIRAQVRAAAVTALNAVPSLAGRVFVDQEYVLQPNQLPALMVAVSESASLEGTFSDGVERTITLQLRAVAKATSGLSAALDAISHAAEGALMVNGLPVAGRTFYPDAFGAEVPEISALGDQPVGELSMDFVFSIPTQRAAPGLLA
jgi:hypothetical protein